MIAAAFAWLCFGIIAFFIVCIALSALIDRNLIGKAVNKGFGDFAKRNRSIAADTFPEDCAGDWPAPVEIQPFHRRENER